MNNDNYEHTDSGFMIQNNENNFFDDGFTETPNFDIKNDSMPENSVSFEPVNTMVSGIQIEQKNSENKEELKRSTSNMSSNSGSTVEILEREPREPREPRESRESQKKPRKSDDYNQFMNKEKKIKESEIDNDNVNDPYDETGYFSEKSDDDYRYKESRGEQKEETRGEFKERKFETLEQEKLYYLKHLKMMKDDNEGITFSEDFSMRTSLDELKMEYIVQTERLSRKSALSEYKQTILGTANFIELINGLFNPTNGWVKLDGWSQSLELNFEQFHNTLVKLYEKYKDSDDLMSPEFNLLRLFIQSAFIFAISQKVTDIFTPQLSKVISQDSDLSSRLFNATMNAANMSAQQGHFNMPQQRNQNMNQNMNMNQNQNQNPNMNPNQNPNMNQYVNMQAQNINRNGPMPFDVNKMSGPSEDLNTLLSSFGLGTMPMPHPEPVKLRKDPQEKYPVPTKVSTRIPNLDIRGDPSNPSDDIISVGSLESDASEIRHVSIGKNKKKKVIMNL
jgi:hypothetical protein